MDSPWGGPRFFKILLQHNIEANYMLIPKKFAKEHCRELSNQIILKVPNGEAWPVELVRDDEAKGGLVWFGKGWQKFSERYCFRHGHFLLFELLHNSSFLVLIFNRTAAEIDYSKQDWELAQTETMLESADVATDVAGKGENLSSTKKTPVVVSKKLSSQRASSSAAANVNVLPSFKKVINRSCPAVPMKFVEKYVTKSSEEMVELKVDGESWAVKLKIYQQASYCQLSEGWIQFAKDNNLKAGDTCTFVLASATSFNVHISRC